MPNLRGLKKPAGASRKDFPHSESLKVSWKLMLLSKKEF